VFQAFTEQHLRAGLKTVEEIKKKTAGSKPGRLKNEW
jgi:hypothetical protein